MSLKLPPNAEAAFRIETVDAFERRFAINLYGAGRGGWFVATIRGSRHDRDSGVRLLPEGEWPTLQRLIEHCEFWELPEDGDHLVEPGVEVCDGEDLTIVGREKERQHRLTRFVWREPGLEAILSFARRVSGFFVRDPGHGPWAAAEQELADEGEQE